jgi:hypothetical protein
MKIRLLSHLAGIAFVIALLFSVDSYAQVPWSGAYGNEWIVPGQKYARIPVKAKGIYQVDFSSLPTGFPAPVNLDRLQLWHRGVQVAILSVDASKIVFYGEPNDGKFDELLTRPDPAQPTITSRMNKYVSLFSDEGVYFLTEGASNGLRANTIESSSIDSPSNTLVPYHVKVDTTLFKSDFSHTTFYSTYPLFLNSFYEYNKTLTGPRFSNAAVATQTFKLNNLYSAGLAGVPVKVKVLLNCRGRIAIDVNVKIGAKGGSLRQVQKVNINAWGAREYEFTLDPATDIDVNGEGQLVFGMEAPETISRFSISYITISYPQLTNVQGKSIYILNLPEATSNDPVKLSIANLSGIGISQLFDITNANVPVKIIAQNLGDFSVPQVSGAVKSLLVSSAVTTVVGGEMSLFTGGSTVHEDYADKDFIIITTNEDLMVDAAQRYADYRKGTKNSLTGTQFKPIVLKIKDIYNQYNYGEPSAVAIRRCMDFMLKDKNFKKYLLLIGNSKTYNNGNREMLNEVPTAGYPGSDFLLVSGLAGTGLDFQTIPVGRIPAGTPAKVDAYLSKVIEYEGAAPSGAGWRKNVLHIAGGKKVSEISSFSSELATRSTQNVVASPFSGTTFAYTKDISDPCPDNHGVYVDCQTAADPAIETKVNDGVGVLTYYGHGNPRVTDYFFGYVSDNTTRAYKSTKKYTAFFLYGCDVNNVFTGVNENVGTTASDRRAFTVDWLLTPDRGAITVVGNSWEGYEFVLTPYLRKEYAKLFVAEGARPSIGSLLKDVANETMDALPGNNARIAAITPDEANFNYNYTQANVHQTILLGDPSIILAAVNDPLPVEWLNVSAKLTAPNLISVDWKTASEKDNSHFIVERSADAKTFVKIGQVDGSGNTDQVTSYSYVDNAPLSGVNYYRIAQMDIIKDQNQAKPAYSRIMFVENPIEEKVVVAPNPSPDIFKIKVSNLSSEVIFWSLLDVKGNVLIQKSDSDSVDLSLFADGIYILDMSTKDGGKISKRLIKK